MLGGELGAKIADPSQRSRQYEPIVQRHLPDRHAYRRREEIIRRLLPALTHLHARARQARPRNSPSIVKIGRTHTMDATPADARPGIFRLCRAGEIRHRAPRNRAAARALSPGARRHRGRHRPQRQARLRQDLRQDASRSSPTCPSSARRTSSSTGRRTTPMLFAHGALNALAADLFKIANDIRLLGSGPRSGFGEAHPAGERARLLDHAGQGQSDPERSADHGLLPGVRQPDHHHGRRQPGSFRAQCLQAGDGLRHAAIDPPARRRGALASPTIASSASRPTKRVSAN